MIDIKNLNRETKIFFVILVFLFLLGILFRNMYPFFSSSTLRVYMGALIGSLYLCGVKSLEVYRTGRKYSWEDISSPRKINDTLIAYILFFTLVGAVGWITGINRNLFYEGQIFYALWLGTLLVLVYFGGLGRLKIYKEDSEKEK